MRLHVDLETLQLIEGPGFRNPVTFIRAKRGDGATFEVQFLEDGVTPVQIGAAETLAIKFGAKENGHYASDYLVLDDAWTLPEGEDTTYACAPNLNTAELNAALGVGGANELASITLMAEIEWSTGGLPTSTRTFPLVIENDVNRGTEGTPLSITDTPVEWLRSNQYATVPAAVRSFIGAHRPPNLLPTAARPLELTMTMSGSFSGTVRSTTGYARALQWNGVITANAGTGNPASNITPSWAAIASPYNGTSIKYVGIYATDSAGIPSGALTYANFPTKGVTAVCGCLEEIVELAVGSSDLSGLGSVLTAATTVTLGSASLYDFDTALCPAVQILDLSNNSLLENLDLSSASALGSLTLTGCARLTELDLSANPLLTALAAGECSKLESVDLTGCPLLASLALSNCLITELDLSGNPALANLTSGGCVGLTEVDLSPCPELALVSLGSTSITSIDVTGLPKLTSLSMASAPVMSIDTSECPLLAHLYLSSTSVSQIATAGNPVLVDISASNCPVLSTVDLSGTTLPGVFQINACTGLASVRAVGVGNITYCNFAGSGLGAAALNQFYTDLAGGTGTIVVTGCPGVSDPLHDPTIATAKGYTVVTS